MAKVFLTKCFAPFKPLSFDELDVGLSSSLVIDLQHLQKTLEEKPPSLKWCSEAMFVVKKIHSHFLLYFEKSKVAVSWEGVNMVDEYMRATLELLDLCNLIKSAISSLDRYRMMVDFVVKRLEEAELSIITSKIELARLNREKSNKLFDVEQYWKEINVNKEGVTKIKLKTRTNMHILQALRTTMSIISLLIFCSILHPIPIKIDEEFYTRLPYSDSFLVSLRKLVDFFYERVLSVQDNGRDELVLYENGLIEDAIDAFKAQFGCGGEVGVDKEKLEQYVEELKKRSLALKEGLELFESVVNELFEDVVKGRKKMIDMITIENHTA